MEEIKIKISVKYNNKINDSNKNWINIVIITTTTKNLRRVAQYMYYHLATQLATKQIQKYLFIKKKNTTTRKKTIFLKIFKGSEDKNNAQFL